MKGCIDSGYLVEIGKNGLADFTADKVLLRLAKFTIDYCGGNMDWAADELGVHETTIRRWLKKEITP